MPALRLLVLVAAAAVAAAFGTTRLRPTLSATPQTALLDAPIELRVSGLRADEAVRITVTAPSHLGKPWRTVLAARTGSHGALVLRHEYLLARLRPLRKAAASDYLPWAETATITARAGDWSGTTRVTRILRPSSVSMADERPQRRGFYAEWLVPRGARRRTAVLFLGGSEGGLPLVPAAYLLAAHGYPVLAVAYFRGPGLPQSLERIPLEYFRRALVWLRGRPEVDPGHIVTAGVSRGGELSLILGSTYRRLVHGAVSLVGADVAVASPLDPDVPAWTEHGKPVLGPISVRAIAGPVFAVGGGADALWPSGPYAQDLARRRRGLDRRDEILVYPHAGHAAGSAVPNVPELSTTIDSVYGTLDLGGSPAADEAARQDLWPRLLRFLAGLRAR